MKSTYAFLLIVSCILSPAGSEAQTLTDSLVAYYPFNGNANDESGNGNDGVVVGTTLSTDRFGNPNRSQQLAAGSYISVPDNPEFNVSANFTISVWYKMQPGAIASNMTIADKRPGNAAFWGLYIEQSTALEVTGTRVLFALFNNFSNLDYQYSQNMIAEDSWAHVAVVVRNDTSLMYLNGALDSVSPISVPRPTNTSPFEIGSPGGSGRGESFVGWLDDIRVYNRALAEEEISLLYHEGGWNLLNQALVAYYPFNGNANDSSGNGNHGTVHGTILSADRFGNPNSSYAFNGTSDFIDVADSPSLRTPDSLTISAWVKKYPNMSMVTKAIVVKGIDQDQVNPDYLMVIDHSLTDDNIRIHLNTGGNEGWNYFNGSTILEDSIWYHLVSTYDGSVVKTYVNGVEDGSNPVIGPLITSAYPLSIGTSGSSRGFSYFPGYIDDIRIYNRALSQEEVGLLYHEGGWGVVPIQLATFNATIVNQNSVRLVWTTLSEINNFGFYLYRRGPTDQSFSEVSGSFVPGHGTTVAPQSYAYLDTAAMPGPWWYRLKQIDLNGPVHFLEPLEVRTTTGVQEDVPAVFGLAQNYPNPFNPTTQIRYGLPARAHVTLSVFNALGQEVARLVNGTVEMGYHEVRFDGAGLSSGVYFYRLQAGANYGETRKLLLLR